MADGPTKMVHVGPSPGSAGGSSSTTSNSASSTVDSFQATTDLRSATLKMDWNRFLMSGDSKAALKVAVLWRMEWKLCVWLANPPGVMPTRQEAAVKSVDFGAAIKCNLQPWGLALAVRNLYLESDK